MPKKTKPTKLNRDQQRDLDIEISFIEGVVRRDPDFVEALQILGDDYTRRGRIPDGLRVDEELARLRPDEPNILYNLACSYSLVGQFDQAFDALENALARGYQDFHWLARDPDLAQLRKDPRYKAVRAKIRALKGTPKTVS